MDNFVHYNTDMFVPYNGLTGFGCEGLNLFTPELSN